MDNPILYVLLNGELNMSPGKASAQAVHAAVMIPGITKFGKKVKRTVIVLEAKNTQQIFALRSYLKRAKVPCEFYIDEGHNEVDPYSVTALAVGPIPSDDLKTREILRNFSLFPKKKGWFK